MQETVCWTRQVEVTDNPGGDRSGPAQDCPRPATGNGPEMGKETGPEGKI